MKRRDFLLRASGAAGGTAVAAAGAPASAQETTSSSTTGTSSPSATTGTASGNTTGNASANGTTGNASGNASGNQTAGSSGGSTKQVAVGPGGNYVFDPEEVTIAPGTTVKWSWESDNHNIVPNGQPDGAGWEGTAGAKTKTYNTGHTYSHTFDTTGTYKYYCNPHKNLGMRGSVVVQQGGASSGGGGGEEEADPEEMGVPLQAHWVGIATLLMLMVTFVFTFFQLKYGESPNAKGGN